MKAIIFEPKFQIGDVVESILQSDELFVVNSYTIQHIDNAGQVISFTYYVGDGYGAVFYFKEHELKQHIQINS